ncbi:FRIGIDA-like protein 4a [Humulus lupulus]|uniref:FRIGIDA-like protein 4a n=1 Tax=Humulus lupulus TaxID=3486 RepID=UPI002B40E3DD|nr:FRIGIDA-like protein 4a [Humulus lupulus]
MSTTIDKSPSELQSSSDPNNPQIRKAFNFLKAHASAVASFTLQWQDLEDHLQSINNSIQSKLDEIQQSQKPQNTQLPKTKKSEPSSQKEHLSSTLQPLIDSKETKLNTTDSQLNTPKTQVKPDESLPAKVGANGIPVRDGKSLMDYLKKNLKEHESIREDVRHALKGLKDSGKVVLDAIKGFYPPGLKTGVVDPELSALRRSSVLLLEELINVRPLINGRVKEEASKLSSVWKSKMNLEMVNSMEVWGFLLLLNGYGLAGEYNMDEILNLVGTVVQRKQAPEMFRSLGFSDKASDFIQKLISQDKLIEAIRFIYTFELVDKFPPVPLLKAHLQEAKKVANSILKNSYNSSKLKDDAANKEIAAMRSVIRCVEDYKLESEFSPENLKEQIESLRKQKRERAPPTHSALAAKAQMQQQQSGQKRTLHDSKTQMKRQDNRSKHPRTVPTAGALNYSGRAPTTVQLHHRSAGGYEGERTDYLLKSDRMAAASNVSSRAAALQAMHHSAEGLFEGEGAEYYLSARMPTSGVNAAAPAPNPSFGASSNIYSIEASRYQPTASYTGQGTEYSSRYYNLARSILDLHTNLPSGSHGLTSSPPVTQQTNLAGGNYSLSNSNPETHHMSSAHYGLAGSGASTAHMNSSADLYGISVGTSGRRTEQFGSTGAVQAAAGITSNVSPHSNLAYYPGDPPLRAATYNDRPASSSSGYEMLSNRPYVFHL